MDEWNGRERREKNQWSIDSWSALQSAATLLMMAVAGLIWGIKLENRIDMMTAELRSEVVQLSDKQEKTDAMISRGILPITEIKMRAMEDRIVEIEKNVDACMGRKK